VIEGLRGEGPRAGVQGLHNTKYRVIGLCRDSAGLRGEVIAKGLGETYSSRGSALLPFAVETLGFAIRTAWRMKALILFARHKLEPAILRCTLSFAIHHAGETKALRSFCARKFVRAYDCSSYQSTLTGFPQKCTDPQPGRG
jgi:hypothetical protein